MRRVPSESRTYGRGRESVYLELTVQLSPGTAVCTEKSIEAG